MIIATADFETDPFAVGIIPKPFTAGYYDGNRYVDFWSPNCANLLIDFLVDLDEEMIVYFHNGGKFDFFFFLERLDSELKIVNGRIIQAKIGKVEFRDSYAAIPIPLAAYKKDDVDYSLFVPELREQHKEYILKYQKNDCVYLHELVMGFRQEFGDRLTIGGAAINELKRFHKFKQSGKGFDEKFRPFYFGGRNQCFKSGIITFGNEPIKVFDVHSMYPSVMNDELHPVGLANELNKRITKDTQFILARGYNEGAFPLRTRDGLDFTAPYGDFYTTIHEWNAAEETGTFKCEKILKTYEFTETIRFEAFVQHFYNSRLAAERDGNKLLKLLYKLVLNSAYGKFATDPDNFKEWTITRPDELPDMSKPWAMEFVHMNYIFWSRPSETQQYYNVATAASITGAARAKLLRGLCNAENPLYCDTDSIICTGFHGEMHASKLGTWGLEETGSHIAIAGKKMYALFDGDECVKQANKGARLTPAEIVHVAEGGMVEYANPVPAFKLDGKHQFTTRKIRATAKV